MRRLVHDTDLMKKKMAEDERLNTLDAETKNQWEIMSYYCTHINKSRQNQ
jgi:hypothetical protein